VWDGLKKLIVTTEGVPLAAVERFVVVVNFDHQEGTSFGMLIDSRRPS
jgi:hypothetical protein